MLVLPVLDLMGGVVVRGMGGRREEYRPITSPLVASAAPVEVASAISTKFGCREFYVADLDAIAGREPAWKIYAALMTNGWRLWVDAGLADLPRARALAEFVADGDRIGSVIAGLESLHSQQQLVEMLDVVGCERLVFSLDLKQGKPLANEQTSFGGDPFEIAREAIAAGVERMIVLDLAGVGQHAGVTTLDLCRRIHEAATHVELIAGGGVRGVHDLQAMATSGCRCALVASALHDGRLTPEELVAVARI